MRKLWLLGACALGFLLQAQAKDAVWLTDMPKALKEAKAEHKIVLADFTGSDWCAACKRMDNDTFSKPEFAKYAKKHLVLVQLDYPDNKPQSDELKAANAALSAKYAIIGCPTLIALKPDATVLWRKDGYLAGGPKALIDALEAAKQK
jgi:thiol:disulfide interchange protein